MLIVYGASSPGASSSMKPLYWSASSLIRSPTTASSGAWTASASWAALVIGVAAMNGRRLIVPQASVSLFVTVPATRTIPRRGIVDGVSWSMVTVSGVSSAVRLGQPLGAPAHRRGALARLARG